MTPPDDGVDYRNGMGEGSGGEEEPRVVRQAPEALLLEESALALASQAIPHELQPREGGWALLVPASLEAAALPVLALFDEENRRAPAPEPEPTYGLSLLAPLFALFLLGCFAVTGERDPAAVWFVRGSADAAAIVHGAWWRCATALTLHEGLEHVGGNAFLGALLLAALTRRLGPAAALWVSFLAGVAGNALTALAWRSHFNSIGASTAVFGALGALAAVALFARAVKPMRRLIGIGAALGLLAMLGTGEHADVLAHAFGLLCGLGFGAVAVRLLPRPPARTLLQPALALLVPVALALCWMRALR